MRVESRFPALFATLGLVLLPAALGGAAADEGSDGPSETPAKRTIDFARDIRPVFAARCYTCHGPDEQEGDLRLDRRAAAQKGGSRGPLVLPGKPETSLLIQMVTGENDDLLVMPPEGQPLTKRQIALLRAWIDQGAKWPADIDGEPAASDHWSFQPLAAASPPDVNDTDWVRSPIDRFVLARLEQEGIGPSPPADRRTLIRRLSLDLLGLPPTPEDVAAFVADSGPDAYERLVDGLLASPHFGERWGRHWLDLARYADSDGYEDDKYRPDAWRYRDWVVDSFNSDQPFDEFTVHQLAGDVLDEAGYDERLATGFHRMTLSNGSGGGGITEEFRVKAVKDRINTTGTVWMGLTVGCAQCHSHKYDPISLGDYYRLYAFFNNAEEVSIAAPPLPQRYQIAYDNAVDAYRERICNAEEALSNYELDALPGKQEEWERSGSHEGVPESLKQILAIPRERRSQRQRDQLTDYYRSIDQEYLELQRAVPTSEEIKNNRPLPPSSHALTVAENRRLRETRIHKRGNFLDKGEPVEPGVPDFLPELRTDGRNPDRLALARWIVDPDHPLTSRVGVNHVWQHLFGHGLVPTPDDFGLHGQPPSHPQLLDWLAEEFIRTGWRRKSLIRLIVCSATYRQSSRQRAELADRDPENRLLWRQNRFRVEAEIVRDLALAASGLLERRMGGPGVQPPLPTGLMQLDTLKTERFMEPSTGPDRYRRGVYTNVQRTFVNPMLGSFDVNDPNGVCTRRDRSNTPLQALTLLNDPAYFECAQALALRVLRECTGDRRERIGHAFRLCLSRSPDERELAALDELLEIHLRFCRADSEAAAEILGVESVPDTKSRLPDGVDVCEAAAWVGLSRTLLNLDEFITRE